MIEKLGNTWITDGVIDFEYKQYILLAYLKKIRQEFSEDKLYPHLKDVMDQYYNLAEYRRKKDHLSNLFPKNLKGLDFPNQSLMYEDKMKDDPILSEIDDIVDYSLTELGEVMDIGRDLYDTIHDDMIIESIGLISKDSESGILMIESDDIITYSYKTSEIVMPDEIYHTLICKKIKSYELGSLPYNGIKNDLLEILGLDEATAYLVRSERYYPLEESLLPITKRSILTLGD